MISIFKNQFDTLHIKQRFTIKKLSIGVVSVLVGFTFCGLNGQSVSADSILETDSTSTVVSANPTVDEEEYTSIPVSDIKGNARSVSVTSEIDSTSFNDSTNVIKLDTKDEVVVGIQPDGSTDGATIPVIIANKTQAETNNPVGKKLTITVNGKLPDASNSIQNNPSMPEGTTYHYKIPIDTTKPGIKYVVVVVTYPDGSSDEVNVQLTVQSHAETYNPIGQNQTVKIGVEPDPCELIANSIALPESTKYSYKEQIDTTTPGVKRVVVVFTYPDGSSDEVTITVIVKANPTQAEMNTPNQPILKDESLISNISNCSVQTTNLKEKSLDDKSLVDINQTTDLPSTGTNKHNSNSVFRILSISTLVGLSMAKIRRNKAQF